MSLILKSISIRNFLGFGNKTETVDLLTPGTMLILGENVDRGGNNGCGKSTIVNAISYALYNKPLEIISKERLVNTTNNIKKTVMEVSLDFEVEGTNYRIKRGRGADYDTKFYINDEDKTPDSIDNINKAIVDIIGMSYDLFRRCVVFKGSDTPFFEMPVSQQRSLIEELFRITMLSEKAENLKKLNQNIEKDIDVQTTMITAQEKARDLRSKHIADAEARIVRWESDKETKLNTLRAHFEKVSLIDFDAQESLHKQLEHIVPLQKDHAAMIKETGNHIAIAEKKIVKATGELSHLKDAKCPYCLQEFSDTQAKIEELEALILENDTKLSEFNETRTQAQSIYDELELKRKDLAAQLLYSTRQAMMTDKMNVSGMQAQITNLESSANPHLEAYETLLSEHEVVVDYSKLDELKSGLEHQKFLLKLLVDKNSHIRKKIINKSIPFLNKQIHIHSKLLGLPHLVSFNPDMSCSISEYGRELDYGNLSGGEKKRLNLALSMAFRDMLHHLHSNINMLILDEVDGGAMDPIGVEAMIRSMKLKSQQEKDMGIWVISHRPECTGRFDREMTVKFENGFSSIDNIEVL